MLIYFCCPCLPGEVVCLVTPAWLCPCLPGRLMGCPSVEEQLPNGEEQTRVKDAEEVPVAEMGKAAAPEDAPEEVYRGNV